MHHSREETGQGANDLQPDKVCNNLYNFIAFVDDRVMLHRLGCMYDHDGLKLFKMDALEEDLNELENGVFLHEQEALCQPRKAYIEHVKHFKNHLIKPFDESAMDFYNAMMDYSMMFKYMQPPYTRSVQSFFEAK